MLLAGGSVLLSSCRVATEDPVVVEFVSPYWKPAIQSAAEAITTVGGLEAITLTLAEYHISLRQFAVGVGRYGEQANQIGYTLARLEPPSEARLAHASLLAVADSLVRIVASAQSFLAVEDLRLITAMVAELGVARANLFRFVAAIADETSRDVMGEQLAVLGELTFVPSTISRFAVMVGEFDSEIEMAARLGRYSPDARLAAQYPGWSEIARHFDAEGANAAAQIWDQRGFRVRIEMVPDIAIAVTVASDPLGIADWREPLWTYDLPFDVVGLAVSDDGGSWVCISREGQVLVLNRQGVVNWQRELNIPADGIAVNGDGTIAVGYGFFLAPLDDTGRPLWPQVKDQADNQIIEHIGFAAEDMMLARTTNNRGEGRAFIHRRDGRRWRLDAGSHSSGIGVSQLSADGSTLAVGTTGADVEQVVTVYQAGSGTTRTLVTFQPESSLVEMALSANGALVLLGTDKGLAIHESASGRLLHHIPLDVQAIRADPLGRVVYVSTTSGLKAFGFDGQLIWSNQNFAPSRFKVSANYLVAMTSPTTVSVLTATGIHVGDAGTLAPIREFALGRLADVLCVASAERLLQAWQLPAVEN